MKVYRTLGTYVAMGGLRSYPLCLHLPVVLTAFTSLRATYAVGLLVVFGVALANDFAHSCVLGLYVTAMIRCHRILALFTRICFGTASNVQVPEQLRSTFGNTYKTLDARLEREFVDVQTRMMNSQYVLPVAMDPVTTDEFMHYLRHLAHLAAHGDLLQKTKSVIKMSILLRSNLLRKPMLQFGVSLSLLALLLLLVHGMPCFVYKRELRRPPKEELMKGFRAAESHKLIVVANKTST